MIGDNLIIVIGIDIDILCLVVVLFNLIIRWLFNGLVIKEGNLCFVKVVKMVLNFVGVILEDIGFYICYVNNIFGKDIKIMFLFLISEYLKFC